MARCLISFGANLGVPAVTIGQAVQQIRQLLGARLQSLELSRLVRTPAVGGPSGQPPFVNAVAALHVSDCNAWDLWHIVREVEHALGRVRQERWEARRIDLDVLLFDDQRIWTPQFKLPHPRMVMRRFILQPALDVASDWIEPVSGWTIRQLAEALTDAPASLVLISYHRQRDQAMIDGAAQVASCEWTSVHLHSAAEEKPHVAAPSGRWLSRLAVEELAVEERVVDERLALPALVLSPTPRLVCLLAPPSHVTDAAWEDVHRPIARWMNLCPSQADGATQLARSTEHWPLNGPRYLLSTDDLAWAQHEIVAAMDAMDCPVEPMKS